MSSWLRWLHWHRLRSGTETRWWFWNFSVSFSFRREKVRKSFFRP